MNDEKTNEGTANQPPEPEPQKKAEQKPSEYIVLEAIEVETEKTGKTTAWVQLGSKPIQARSKADAIKIATDKYPLEPGESMQLRAVALSSWKGSRKLTAAQVVETNAVELD